jgi:microcystin-dependent protein
MAESSTANLGWTKPDPGASANTWGTTLNGTTDKIDAAMFALQQAQMPIGSIVMWGGAAAPPNWLLCNGAQLVITAYQALYNVIQTAFNVAGVPGGSFNLPNLTQKFPLGAGPNPLGTSGGAFSVTIGTGNLPAHTHTISDPQHYHNISQGNNAHGHGFNQWSHNHGDTGHGHGVSASGSQDNHTHGGVTTVGGGSGLAFGANYGNVGSNTGGASASGVYVSVGINTGYASIDSRTSSGSVQANTTGIVNTDYNPTNIPANTGSTGSNTPLSVVPPFQAVNYIIRYQ